MFQLAIDGGLEFNRLHLKIPLLDYTQVGRAKNQSEMVRCTGGTIASVENEYVERSPVIFQESIVYDGTKIIIPSTEFCTK